MGESKLHYLKYLDMFPEDAGFVNEGKRDFRSYIGAILSFLMIIAILIVALLFGQEVYKRKKIPNSH